MPTLCIGFLNSRSAAHIPFHAATNPQRVLKGFRKWNERTQSRPLYGF